MYCTCIGWKLDEYASKKNTWVKSTFQKPNIKYIFCQQKIFYKPMRTALPPSCFFSERACMWGVVMKDSQGDCISVHETGREKEQAISPKGSVSTASPCLFVYLNPLYKRTTATYLLSWWTTLIIWISWLKGHYTENNNVCFVLPF